MLDMAPQTIPTVLDGPALAPRRRDDGRVDGRAPITAWGLMQWAYGREMVRFAGGSGRDWSGGLTYGASATGAVCDRLAEQAGVGLEGRGSINARCSAHGDAEAVHAWVSRRPTAEFWALVRAAEAARVPEWDPVVPPGRLVPVQGRGGRPRMMLCPVARRVVACLVEQVGVPAHEVEAVKARARAAYARWVWLLCELAADGAVDKRLTRWRIEGIGVPLAPWMGDCGRVAA